MTLQRIPVSDLDENTDVSPDAVVHVVQDGVSKKAGVGNLVGIGDFATIADLEASRKLTDGKYYTVSSAFNGEPETFLYDADSTLTADGALVVDAAGMGAGRLVSTRTTYADFAELDGDTRALTEGTALRWGGFDYTVSASGATDHHLTTAGGVKLYVMPTPGGVVNYSAFAPNADGATSDQDSLQLAMDYAHSIKCDLYVPAGSYLVTGLVLPGDTVSTDDRDKAFRLFGQGTGEPFVHTNTGGTVILSVTDAPVLTDILGTASSSNGTVEIDHIRFDGTSTTPVVKLTSFYGLSSFHNNVIYQRSTGGGFEMGWGATVHIYENYAMNSQFNTTSVGASRTGIGFSWVPTANNGLVTFYKNTSRGFLTGYNIGGSAGAPYSPIIDACEASVVYNGIIINSNARSANITKNYIEGGDGGIGIKNTGDQTTISGNLIFSGFSKVIEDTNTLNKGTLIQGNLISLGAVANAIGVDIASSATRGGYNKTVNSNSIVYTLGTAGVNGIKISGTASRLTAIGNSFDPKEEWTGAGTSKINDTSTGTGTNGLITSFSGDFELPFLANGAISLFPDAAALTEANVASNTLTLPYGVSYFAVTPTTPITVQIFDAGLPKGRIVILRTTNSNTTIQNTSYIKTAGGASFTGPGTITFFCDYLVGSTYAYEISRTVF